MDPEKISRLKITGKEPLEASTGSRRTKLLVVILCLGAFAALAVAAVRSGLLTPATTVRTVAVSLVYPSQIVTNFIAGGYVVAQRKAAVASKGTGRIEYMGAFEGKKVVEGEVLARLDSDDLKAERGQMTARLAASQADLRRAETELKTADLNFKRLRGLDKRTVSRQDLEAAEDRYGKALAAVEVSRASIREMQATIKHQDVLIGYTIIRAPFAGVVLTKDADVGEVVAPFGSSVSAKAAVVNMADMNSLMVQADVSESFLSRVTAGGPCEIRLDALPDTRFSGRVNTIVPTADRSRGTVQVKVAFDRTDPRILPETGAKVAFLDKPVPEGENIPFPAVHRDALALRDGAPGVFAVEEDRARWIPLPSGETVGDYVRVPPELSVGRRMVMGPAPGLRDGSRIKWGE